MKTEVYIHGVPIKERVRVHLGKRESDLPRLVSARAAGLHKEKIEKEKAEENK